MSETVLKILNNAVTGQDEHSGDKFIKLTPETYLAITELLQDQEPKKPVKIPAKISPLPWTFSANIITDANGRLIAECINLDEFGKPINSFLNGQEIINCVNGYRVQVTKNVQLETKILKLETLIAEKDFIIRDLQNKLSDKTPF